MNEITVKEANTNTLAPSEDYKKIAAHYLESMGMLKKFTKEEQGQFIDVCAAYGLNPIKKEVYGIKYGDKFNLIIGYESYIKRAERSGRLDGWNVEVIGSGADMKAVLTIYRKDFKQPFKHEVYLEEYTTNRDLWLKKPRTMIKKVAIAQGFRLCFSEELGGMPYTSEELGDLATMPEQEESKSTEAKAEPKRSFKKENVENAEVVSNKKPTLKLYTVEQASELGEIMNSTYSNGENIFTEEEKNEYKKMLINGKFENALKGAKEILEFRLDDAGENSTSSIVAEVEKEAEEQ